MHPVTTAFLSAAARTLGAQIVRDLYGYLEEQIRGDEPSEAVPRATMREVQTFLDGGPFAGFVANKVIRDACARFSALPVPEQQAVVAAAARQPTAAAVVRDLVAYMAQRP